MLKWFTKKAEVPKAENAPEGDPSATGTAEAAPEAKKGLFSRLRERLGKTQSALAGRLRAAIGLREKIDEELLEEIEEILIQADVGARSAAKIVDYIRKEGPRREATGSEAVTALVRESVAGILSAGNRKLELSRNTPEIVLVVGVNGTGKTTTIGKLALELTRQGKRVMLIAADTFRAAAVEQLGIWAERTGACLVSAGEGSDPASVCFEGLASAKNDGADVILIDTAGRLHTKTYLMDELGKVVRVIKKQFPDAPHETILVLDATTGQNALNQVTTFREVAQLTGLIMTKLDGTAKGGILIAIKEAHPLPVFKIGIGEAPEDLRDFDAEEFARALFGGEE